MKTYFRVTFRFSGWEIEYRNGRFGEWEKTRGFDKQGTTCFSLKEKAEAICNGLRNGESYDSWFIDPAQGNKSEGI